jgi:hypothetical protein
MQDPNGGSLGLHRRVLESEASSDYRPSCAIVELRPELPRSENSAAMRFGLSGRFVCSESLGDDLLDEMSWMAFFVVDELIHSVFVNLVILHWHARKQTVAPK